MWCCTRLNKDRLKKNYVLLINVPDKHWRIKFIIIVSVSIPVEFGTARCSRRCTISHFNMTCCRSRDLLDIASPVRCIHVMHILMFHFIICLTWWLSDKCCLCFMSHWIQFLFKRLVIFSHLIFCLCHFSVVDGERRDLGDSH